MTEEERIAEVRAKFIAESLAKAEENKPKPTPIEDVVMVPTTIGLMIGYGLGPIGIILIVITLLAAII